MIGQKSTINKKHCFKINHLNHKSDRHSTATQMRKKPKINMTHPRWVEKETSNCIYRSHQHSTSSFKIKSEQSSGDFLVVLKETWSCSSSIHLRASGTERRQRRRLPQLRLGHFADKNRSPCSLTRRLSVQFHINTLPLHLRGLNSDRGAPLVGGGAGLWSRSAPVARNNDKFPQRQSVTKTFTSTD